MQYPPLEFYVQEREGSEEAGARWHEATAALGAPRRVGAAGPPLPWWARAHDAPPAKPVFAGTDLNGGPLYVGRAWHEGQLLPAKVAPAYDVAFVAWNGREHSKYDDQYEVLHLRRGRAEWVEASDGVVPAHAFPVGISSGGRLAFSARAAVEGIVTPGWIAEGNSRCHVSYGDKEWLFKKYEVLAIL
ncbi:hypothetical protein R5R35_003028 [Gryllus longicercus]